MTLTSDERERPHEWLRHLSQDPHVWSAFIASDDVLGCAYRVAVARRRVIERCSARPIPTLREVDAALCELEARGCPVGQTPRDLLSRRCRERGFVVIEPESRRAA